MAFQNDSGQFRVCCATIHPHISQIWVFNEIHWMVRPMMQRNIMVCVLLFSLAYSNVSVATDADLLPSEVTTLINQAMRFQPDTERTLLTGPIISRMISTDLSRLELFMQGEAHFLNLDPEPARDVFWEYRNTAGNIGRVATQRLMIIRINAFSMVDEVVNNDIPTYRERFNNRADDRHGITFPVMRAAMQLLEKSEIDRALDLLVDEVRHHNDFDGPYTAYQLPGRFMTVAEKNGRGKEFRDLQRWVLNGLDDAINERLESRPKISVKSVEIPGIVFRSIFEDQQLDYYGWTAEFMRLRAAIDEG
jgi:hypothetical protein